MQPKVIRALLLITQVTFNNTILLIFEARLCVCVLSCIQLFAAPWTTARQALLSTGFLRQEY